MKYNIWLIFARIIYLNVTGVIYTMELAINIYID